MSTAYPFLLEPTRPSSDVAAFGNGLHGNSRYNT